MCEENPGVSYLEGIRHERIGLADLYLGDCREVLPDVTADVMITDPVWPNCPAGLLAGSDDPVGLMASAMASMNPVRRAVIVMRIDAYHGPFENQFSGTSISVVILVGEKA